jgi:hypothetical protein
MWLQWRSVDNRHVGTSKERKLADVHSGHTSESKKKGEGVDHIVDDSEGFSLLWVVKCM